jgi:hypothetical protein
MKILKIHINDEVLTKIQKAMDKIEDSRQKESIELSFSELRFLKRLILSDLATMELMFESLNEHRDFVEKQKRGE